MLKNIANYKTSTGILTFTTIINAVMSMIYSTSLQGEKAAVDVPKFKKAMADLGVLYGHLNVSDLFPF